MEWFEEARMHFPVTERFTYLNIALRSSPPRCVQEAFSSFWQRAESEVTFSDHHFDTLVESTRAKVAAMIGAQPGEIAFTKNTSEGINIAASGATFESGDNVIISDHEHPANLYPWLHLKRKGVEVRIARSGSDGLDPEEVFRLCDSRTRAVALSHVGYNTGYVNDLKPYAEFCNRHGVLFVVDAMQSTGGLLYNVRDLGVSIVACGGHKRLLAPNGIGFLYCRAGTLPEILPLHSGDNDASRLVYGDDPRIEIDSSDARKFEHGNLNYPAILALSTALDFINKWGLERIEARVRALTDHLLICLDSLRGEGLRLVTPSGACGIVVIEVSDARAVDSLLSANNVRVSAVSDTRLRFSPHFYNTFDEIAAAVRLLGHFLRP